MRGMQTYVLVDWPLNPLVSSPTPLSPRYALGDARRGPQLAAATTLTAPARYIRQIGDTGRGILERDDRTPW